MRGSSAGQPRRVSFRELPVFAAGHAPRFFLSIPRGVPLPASLEPSRPGRALQSIRLCLFARQRSWGSLAPFAGLIPHAGGDRVSASPGPRAIRPHPALPDRFHRADLVTILCWLVSVIAAGDGFGYWASLPPVVRPQPSSGTSPFARIERSCLGFCPLAGMRTPRREHAAAHRRGLVTATITSPWSGFPDRSAHGFTAPLSADVSACTTGSSTCPGCCLGVAGPSAFYEARAWPRSEVMSRRTGSLSEVLRLPLEMSRSARRGH